MAPFLVNLVGVAIVYSIVNASYFLISRQKAAWSNGCKPAKRQPTNTLFHDLYQRLKSKQSSTVSDSQASGRVLHEQFGHTYYEHSFIGGTRIRTIDEKNVQAIYGSKASEWGVEPLRLAGMRPFMGEGFITNDGHVWQNSRTLLKPCFHKNNISDLSLFEDFTSTLVSKVPTDGTTVDLQPLLMMMFVDTATKFLLGESMGVFDKEKGTNSPVPGIKLLASFALSLRGCAMRIFMGRFRFLVKKADTVDHWKVVHQVVDHYVGKAMQKKEKTSSDKQRSLVEVTIEQTDDKVEIRNQIIQGMTAAQETTPMLISNAIWLLSRSPKHWQRLRAEVQDVTSDSMKLEDTTQFKLLRNILYESLRLYPVFVFLTRVALADTVLPTGGGPDGSAPVFAAAGTSILADFYSLHRDESVFGPYPDDFNPDRWDSISPGPWQFMGFGGGPRSCVGQQKALGEASCVLIQLAQAFARIESRDEKEWTLDQKLTARNANGCKVALFVDERA